MELTSVLALAAARASLQEGIPMADSIMLASKDRRVVWWAADLIEAPNWSRDGASLYFNGGGRIHRLPVSGGEPQVLDTGFAIRCNFPHPSPDGKWIVFLSYEPDVKGHPENRDVMLRLMPAQGGKIEVLARLLGGQGTINVPSWSPDSRRLAFLSYQMVPGP